VLAGGVTSFQGQLTSGRLILDTPDLATSDAAGPRTQGGYAKVLATVYRMQGLSESWRVALNYTGQWARDNLDSSEKFSVGGLAGVRAYPSGEASADDVQLVQMELRHQGFALGQGQFVPFGFYDAARARINHRIFPGFAGSNVRQLAGYGLGAEWTTPGGGFVRAWYARKAGSEAATAEPDRTSRFWTQAGIVF
jgi:hemolysin activation/secretion protein